jgi:sugar O-acyltransferase (sialic acid O-acetyltransferase NeuD family)
MSVEDLIILGAGGGSRELIALIRHAESRCGWSAPWRVKGILDDDKSIVGSEVAGVPVLGTLDDAANYSQARFICGTANSANPCIRLMIAQRIGMPQDCWGTFIHPQATIMDSTVVGHGAIVYPGVSLSSDTCFGAHSLAYYGAVLHHDSTVGEGSILCAGALVAGHVAIGRGCYIGIGAVIRDRIRVDDGALVGAGAVVVKDVAAREIVAGLPARRLKKVTCP